MDAIVEILSRGLDQLFGRTDGPLTFRLVIMPTVVTIIAIRAGFKDGLEDARKGQPAFLWKIFTNPSQRQQLIQSGWKDVGRIVIIALVLDTLYQLIVFRAFYIVQALIVALVCAIVPYILFRGPTTHFARFIYRKKTKETNTSSAGSIENTNKQPESNNHDVD